MKKRLAAGISILTMAAAALAGCGSSKAEVSKYDYRTEDLGTDAVTLTIATKQGSSNGLSALKEAFEAEYPNVTVDVITNHNISEGFENENVDIYMGSYEYELWNDQYASIWKENCIDYKEADLVDLSGLNSDLLSSVTMDGKIYALPLTTGSVGLITNMDLLKKCGIDKAPQTVDELLAACAAVKANGYQPFRCMPINFTYLIEGMTEYEVCKNGENEAFTTAALNADDSIGDYFSMASDFLAESMQNGYIDTESLIAIPEAESKGGGEQAMTTYMQECYAFLHGDVAFFPNYSDVISSIQKRETRLESYVRNPFEYEFIPVPTTDGPAPIRMAAYSLYLNKNSEALAWAEKLVQFAFWRENTKTVGNTAIFADAQYTMSPYDTDQVFTETSQKYYSQFHELFKNDNSCIANDDALLAYHGKGMYAGCVKYGLDAASKGELSVDILSAASISSEAVRQKFVDACKSWYIDGNVY